MSKWLKALFGFAIALGTIGLVAAPASAAVSSNGWPGPNRSHTIVVQPAALSCDGNYFHTTIATHAVLDGVNLTNAHFSDTYYVQDCGKVYAGRLNHCAFLRIAYDGAHYTPWKAVCTSQQLIADTGSYWNGRSFRIEQWMAGPVGYGEPVSGVVWS